MPFDLNFKILLGNFDYFFLERIYLTFICGMRKILLSSLIEGECQRTDNDEHYFFYSKDSVTLLAFFQLWHNVN